MKDQWNADRSRFAILAGLLLAFALGVFYQSRVGVSITPTPMPTFTPPPTQTPNATYTPLPSHTPGATYTPLHTNTPYPTNTPNASYTPLPTHTPNATYTQLATHTPYATLTPNATYTIPPSQTPNATHTPLPSHTPRATYTPLHTNTPYPTNTPFPTATPTYTPTATSTNTPTNTPIPPEDLLERALARIRLHGESVLARENLADSGFTVSQDSGPLNLCGHSADHVANASVEIRLKFNKIQAVYEESNDAYVVVLPPPIISAEVRAQQHDRSFTLCNVDWDAIRMRAEDKAEPCFVARALREGILDSARLNLDNRLHDVGVDLLEKPLQTDDSSWKELDALLELCRR